MLRLSPAPNSARWSLRVVDSVAAAVDDCFESVVEVIFAAT